MIRLTALKTTRHFSVGDHITALRLEKQFNNEMCYICDIDGKHVIYHEMNFKVNKQ